MPENNSTTPEYIDPTSILKVALSGKGHRAGALLLVRGITVFGKDYPSVQQAAKDLKAPLAYVLRRLKPLYQQAWQENPNCPNPDPEKINRAFLPQHIVVKGKVFQSITQAAKYHGIDAVRVYRRLRSLPPNADPSLIDQAFNKDTHRRGRPKRKLFVKGHQYLTIADACRTYGIDQQTAARKLAKLKSPTQAEIDRVFEPTGTHTRNPVPITVKGTQYPSIGAACKALGMRQSTVDARLKRIPKKTPQWIDACFETTFPKLITLADWKHAKIVKGQTYPSIAEACRTLGCHGPTVRRRIARLDSHFTQDEIDRCFR